MSEEIKSQRTRYFNLIKDGDSAVVRLLHSSVSTIESAIVHSIKVDGKSKKIKCLGDDCPLCASKNYSSSRMFIHLYDYTDNTEKIWDRTDKILPQLESLEKSWGALNSAVIKITRKGNEFPKYDIEVQNPSNFKDVSKDLVDKPLAKFYYLNRKLEEVKVFVETGNFPPKEPYMPKDEYLKMKQSQSTQNTTNTTVVAESKPVSPQTNQNSFVPIDDDTLPF